MKGTFGLVSRAPRYVGPGDLWNNGPITRTVLDAARYLDCVVGSDERDPAALPRPARSFEEAARQCDVSALRIAFIPDVGLGSADPNVEAVVREAFAALAAAGNMSARYDVRLYAPDSLACAAPLSALELDPELAPLMAELVDNLQRTEGYETVLEMLARANRGIEGVFEALHLRWALDNELANIFEQVDLLVLPTTPISAFGAKGPMPTTINGREVGLGACPMFTVPFNTSGHPNISVPAGTVNGLPVGLSIVGRRYRDDQVLAAAKVFEQARPWPLLATDYRH
jgi:aspartyl-tRNA(Asn)/glutamyl-tRNA(Gln) amidotransferase subunit A